MFTAEFKKIAIFVAAFAAMATPAMAADADATSATPVTELERRIDTLADALERLEIGRAYVKADQIQYGMGPAASKVYRAQPGLSIGGYGELEAIHDLDTSNDIIDLHRVILYAGYKFNDKWVFNSEIEFEHVNELKVEFAYVDFLARPEIGLRLGHVLVPMGMINELHEPTTYFGVQRPEVERRVIPTTWHENGAGIFGELAGIAYKLYLLNGFDIEKFLPTDDGLRNIRQSGSKAKFNRPAGVLNVEYLGIDGLRVGGSAYAGDAYQDGSLDAMVTIVEGHGEWQYKGLRLRGLAAYAHIANAAKVNGALGFTAPTETIPSDLNGFYGEIGYDVLNTLETGEHRLLPFARISKLDTHAGVPLGKTRNAKNERTILEVGASYLPMDQIVIKMDYRHELREANPDKRLLEAGVGWVF